MIKKTVSSKPTAHKVQISKREIKGRLVQGVSKATIRKLKSLKIKDKKSHICRKIKKFLRDLKIII